MLYRTLPSLQCKGFGLHLAYRHRTKRESMMQKGGFAWPHDGKHLLKSLELGGTQGP